ncbi:PTS system, maltose and glucose-specific IIBC component [Enterococcus ratti]|uniref:PTS system, maltose and glucose-specific IIBC component n=2 Tax=Enterococcus ratti TaxID=150033 RepID=A0A1L8WNX1_9ENTE|nr:PTS system, maltose and glucose-specific IIBC component [Enterococcus ratti]
MKPKKISLWEFFQGLGKTFMLPVALLAFMGIFLGIGSSFSSESILNTLPFLDHPLLKTSFQFLSVIGGFAFTYLPVMFAMAIPLGLVHKEKGIAAFSGFVGYTVMNLTINFYLISTNHLADAAHLREAGQGMVFGIQTIEMGVLGGMIAGLIVYKLHNKFYTIQLPDSFAFFSGTRFVPIITSLVLGIIGLIIPLIWPLFATVITTVGLLIQRSGILGPFLFGSGERLLLPFGLHHILVSMIRFTEAGGATVINGKEIFGALNIFYAELQNNLPISAHATAFLSQGKMPTFIFGLPAAALAMYHTSPLQNRYKIKGLLISGVVATTITGITEPIEFLFLFISPSLWLFHVGMTGLGFMVMALFGVVIGNTDGGILDLIIFGLLQGNTTKWWWVIIIGILWFGIYYFVFKTVILKFDLKTPGREKKERTNHENSLPQTDNYDAKEILAALGGKENIQSLDNCITRLRLVLADANQVDDEKLKQLGALGVVHLDRQNVQVIIGTKVTTVRNQLDLILE